MVLYVAECEFDDLAAFMADQSHDPSFADIADDEQIRSRLLDDLAATREIAGMTQLEVASQMGTTQSAVSELEAGESDPRLSTLQRYSRAVGAKLHVAPSMTNRTKVRQAVGRLVAGACFADEEVCSGAPVNSEGQRVIIPVSEDELLIDVCGLVRQAGGAALVVAVNLELSTPHDVYLIHRVSSAPTRPLND